jgi:hypothetical protein
MLRTPSSAFSPPCDGVPNVLLLVLYIASRLRGVGCVLHLKEPLLLTMEYAAYSCWTRTWAGTTRRAGWAGSCTTTRSCWRFSCHLIYDIEVGGGEILMAILDVFFICFLYSPLNVLVLMLLSFGHHPRRNNIPLFKRSTASESRKVEIGGGHGGCR